MGRRGERGDERCAEVVGFETMLASLSEAYKTEYRVRTLTVKMKLRLPAPLPSVQQSSLEVVELSSEVSHLSLRLPQAQRLLLQLALQLSTQPSLHR